MAQNAPAGIVQELTCSFMDERYSNIPQASDAVLCSELNHSRSLRRFLLAPLFMVAGVALSMTQQVTPRVTTFSRGLAT